MKTNDLSDNNGFQMAILDNALLAIITTDERGLIQTLNPAAEQLLGYKAGEIVGAATPVLFHDQDELKQLTGDSGNGSETSDPDLFSAIIRHLNMKTTEWVFVRKNGTKFPVKISYSPVVRGNGEVKGYICIITDNTQEKKVISTLMQREAYLSAIIENQPGIVWLKDTESRFLATNEAFARSCSAKSKEHLVGKTDFDIWPADLARMYRDDDIKTMKMRKHYKVEEPIFDKGETKWFETFKTPVFNELGEVIGTSGYAIDITDRKNAEAEILHQAGLITSLLDSIPDIVFYKDLNGIYLGCNPQLTELIGKPKSEIIGKSDYDFFDKETADFFRMYDNIMLEKNEPVHNEEWITYPDGRKKLLDTLKTPYRRQDGTLIGILGISRDITERKKAEEEIVKAKNEAESANKAKSEFLSRISHELRTPMNSILGFAQLLEMSVENPQHQKAIKHILNSGRHLLGLINEVLNISQIEAGRIALAIESVQINSIVTEMVDIMSHFAKKRKISIEMPDVANNSLIVSADPLRLRQVLLNLLSNAIKYNTEGGSVQIETSVTEYESTGIPFCRVLIKDTGNGISKENLSKIFLPFERIGAEKTTTEGTGLGLAVVKGLIEIMNGHIGVESVPGKGTSFWIDLPVGKSTGEALNGNNDLISIVPETTDRTGIILYIENNQPNLHLVDSIIKNQRQNVKLVSSANGKDALTLALQHNPNLILLDLNLPDIHGSEVFEILKANEKTRNIPVVIISADAMPHQLDKLLKSGAKHYLTKPIKIAEFMQTIDKFLN